MQTGQRLAVENLSKRFGSVTAVENLSFTVEPGRVTGFLGPNGSGKTTTLRTMLGLVSPTSGTARIGDLTYAELSQPARVVGAALEASGFHPARTARNHLRVLATAAGLPKSRPDEVLGAVGLGEAARRKVGGFSLGMRQRLSLAAALLGDPGVLILDEPANGLDPEGIAWLRTYLRGLAAEGRTILVSSHVLSEVQQTVDDVVIISRGRLVEAGPLEALAGRGRVRVRSPRREDLHRALREGPARAVTVTIEALDDNGLYVSGLRASEVGMIAHRAGLELHELTEQSADLEALFLDLTATGNPGGSA